MNDEQKVVSVGMPIIFENKTDASFEVSTGIVFRKSGVYEVSIVGNKTIVSKVAGLGALKDLPSAQPERKMGRWTVKRLYIQCSECGDCFPLIPQNYCPNCGARMVKEGEEHD